MKPMPSSHSFTRISPALTIGLVALLCCSCSMDEWRAQQKLSKQGYKTVSINSLQTEISNKNQEIASLMISSGVTKEATQEQTSRLLFNAIDSDQSGIVHSLLRTDYSLPTETKTKALTQAISNNQLGVVNAMLKNGFPKEIQMDGLEPLAWTISKKQGAMTRLLLSNGLSPNRVVSADQAVPLEFALSETAPSYVVQELIKSGAETNFTTKSGSPFLHEAILNTDARALETVLKAETKIEVIDPDGNNSLFKALSTGDIEKVKLLHQYGTNLNTVDEEGRTALHISQIFGDFPAVTEYLIANGLQIQTANNENQNALDLALEYTRMDTSTYLLKNKAVASSDTFNRLYKAGNHQAISLLIRARQVDPNTTLTTGDSLLIDSLKGKKTEMVELLLNQGADPNLVAVDLEPPLSYATAIQNYDLMKLLLEAGADPNYNFQSPSPERYESLVETEGAIKWFIERDSGITPIMMACDQGDLKNVMLLDEYGAKNHSSNRYRFWPGNFAARRSITDVVQFMVGAEPGSRERTVLVDLSSQRATVYNKDKETVMSFRISSGKKGNRTRTGEFVVTNKKRNHVSTIYDSDMPYFQRLSYSDFGFHTGYVPGYPASHGCIRCPNSYAYKLYNYLKVGDVVNIQQ